MITFTHKINHVGKGLLRADCQAHSSKRGKVIMGHTVLFRQSGADLAFKIGVRKRLEDHLNKYIDHHTERPTLRYWLKLADIKAGSFFTKALNRHTAVRGK